jgi:hypothetical protein
MRPKVVIIPFTEIAKQSDFVNWVALRDAIGLRYGISKKKITSLHPLNDAVPPWFSLKQELARLFTEITPEELSMISLELDQELLMVIKSKNEILSLVNKLSREVKIVILNPFSPLLSSEISKLFTSNVILFNPRTMGFEMKGLNTFTHSANLAGVNLDRNSYILTNCSEIKLNTNLTYSILDTASGLQASLTLFKGRYTSK